MEKPLLNLDAIPPGRNPPTDLNVFVEIPLGGVPVKYELDKKTGALFVDRFLHTAMYYPGNYGDNWHMAQRAAWMQAGYFGQDLWREFRPEICHAIHIRCDRHKIIAP